MTQRKPAWITGLLAIACCTAIAADPDDRLDRIDEYIAAYQEMAAFDGVVLIVEGESIVYELAYGYADYAHELPMSMDTVFRIASLSKQVTQAAIGRLIDQEKLTIAALLSDFLPDFPNGHRITIHQLLNHSAGIAHTNRLEWMDMHVPMTLDEIVEGLATESLLFTPGHDEQYSNGGYALLARVIEVASGMSFDEFIAMEFSQQGFPSISHESANEVVPGMAGRYAPGPVYAEQRSPR